MGLYTKVAIYQTLNNELQKTAGVFPSEKDRRNIILDRFYVAVNEMKEGKLTEEEFSLKFNNFPANMVPQIMTWTDKNGVMYYTTEGIPMTDEFKSYLTYFKFEIPLLFILLFSPDEFENREGNLKLRNRIEFKELKERLNEIVKHLKVNSLEKKKHDVVDYLYGKNKYEKDSFIEKIQSAKDDSFLIVNSREIYDLDGEKTQEEIDKVILSIQDTRKKILKALKFKPSWL